MKRHSKTKVKTEMKAVAKLTLTKYQRVLCDQRSRQRPTRETGAVVPPFYLFFIFLFFIIFSFLSFFIFGCFGSSLLRAGFL